MAEERKSPLQKELERIEKDFGKGSVISSANRPDKVEVISTGSLKLDLATGIGGLPRGKVVEIMGWESSGKSTIVQQTVGNAQKMGLKCLYIDGEHSIDKTYAAALGVNMNDLLLIQLDEEGGEKCYDMAERLIKTGEIGVAVIDSQTSLLPKKVMQGAAGDNAIGLHARLMSTMVPKIMTAAALTNTLVIYISQFREKIGVMFGSPETTNGGNALKFYAHMRIEVRKSVIREDGQAVGNKTRCKIIKNKQAAPYGEAEFTIDFGKGVDRLGEVIDLAVENDIIKQGGAWYSYKELKVQGEPKLRELLEGTPELAEEIEKQVLIKLGRYEENTTQAG
jgi:recombination protein RecA